MYFLFMKPLQEDKSQKKGSLMNMKSQNCMEQIENLIPVIVKYIHFTTEVSSPMELGYL